MKERRRSRKRNAGGPLESKRLSLLDLPAVADPRGELPTNPALVIRPTRTTLLPVAAGPVADASLASLALTARRSAPPPPSESMRTRESAPTLAPNASEPASPSSLPPPVQPPSEPPREKEGESAKLWLRTLGVIVLSASVGAAVSSLMSGAKTELARATRGDTELLTARAAHAAPPPSCAAAPSPEPTPPVASPPPPVAPSHGPARDAPRISFDTLPVQQRAAPEAEIPASAPREPRPSPTQSEPARLPTQPSRRSVSEAVARASYAATSCDGGPEDGKVLVTFAPSGAVQSVSLLKGFGDAAVNACVLRAFGRARVPAFSGEPVRARKSIAW